MVYLLIQLKYLLFYIILQIIIFQSVTNGKTIVDKSDNAPEIEPNYIKHKCMIKDVNQPIQLILCAIETKLWNISSKSTAILNAGCLLGINRCNNIMYIPKQHEVLPSPPPPNALNKDYQKLAMVAEESVPKIWWRDGFANDMLLLTHNASELPRRQFNLRQSSNKKLRNIYQCVTRQIFIRKSFDFKILPNISKCNAMNERVVMNFYELWNKDRELLGGSSISDNYNHDKFDTWFPNIIKKGNDNELNNTTNTLLVSAIEVLHYFYMNYGGIWTGCFRLDKEPDCRGAIAAAALVASTHFISDISSKQKPFSESHLIRGYILASLGRGLLHGDSSNTGNIPITKWNVILNDFTALQAAYLKLYIDSFGTIYKTQLNKYIPIAFPPSFKVYCKKKFKHLSESLEPVYTSLRNWMFTESDNLIDFSPYRPLVAFQEVRDELLLISNHNNNNNHNNNINNNNNKNNNNDNNTTTTTTTTIERRRVLVDIGANGFFASPKYLLDSYAIYLPFTHAIMVEPVPHFSATIPIEYSRRYNITFLPIYAEVNTNSETDMLRLLPQLVTKDDFVVLKFDVDPNRYAYGPTMEWGFLFSLMSNPEIAELVDELYIELHFHFPSLYWKHYHSNWEALDVIRYLRANGVIVHSWP